MNIKTPINFSPNFSTRRRNKKKIKHIVYHYTGMRSENKAGKRLTDVNSNVSCHYFIKRNGQIILMVPELFEVFMCILRNDTTKYRFTFSKDIHIKIVL